METHVQKRIAQTHHADNQHIHRNRNRNTKKIKTIKPDIPGQPIRDQARAHKVDEVGVQAGVDDGEDDLLGAVPVIVDDDVAVGALQAGGDPDAGDGDVDGDADGEDGPLQAADE